MKIILTILPLITCWELQAQWKDISLIEYSKTIQAIEKRIPENQSYSYQAKYSFFEELNSTDTTLKLDFKLVYNHKKKLLNILQFNQIIIQDEKVKLTIDTIRNMLVISQPNKEYLKKRVQEDFNIINNSSCSAQSSISSKYEKYKFNFAEGARYKNSELWVEKNGMVVKYILKSNVDVNDDSKFTDRIIHPRLDIDYFNYVFNKEIEAQNLETIETYFDDFDKKIVKPKYQHLEIIDLLNTTK